MRLLSSQLEANGNSESTHLTELETANKAICKKNL